MGGGDAAAMKTMLAKGRQLQQPSIEDLHRLCAGQYKISGQRRGSLGRWCLAAEGESEGNGLTLS